MEIIIPTPCSNTSCLLLLSPPVHVGCFPCEGAGGAETVCPVPRTPWLGLHCQNMNNDHAWVPLWGLTFTGHETLH